MMYLAAFITGFVVTWIGAELLEKRETGI